MLQILKIGKSLASISFAQHAATGAFGRRKNRIRVLAGDKVLVEMMPYDVTKGRLPTGSNDRMAPFALVRARIL